MKNIDVSIIVPVYNVEKFLKNSIESLLNQTYKNIEIILINDGSTDGSLNVIKELAKQDNRIVVINKQNTGVSDTRNVGIECAKGKYITFFDSDDYVENTYIEDTIEVMKKYNVELVNVGFFSEVESENTSVQEFYMDSKLYSNKEEIKEDFVALWDNAMLYNIWNKIYVKDIIDKNNIRFSGKSHGEDVEFNMDYLLCTSSLYNIGKCYYHYIRERQGAATNKYVENFYDFRLQEYYDFDEFFEKYGIKKEQYIEFLSRRYLERTLGCVENIFVKNCKLKFKDKNKLVKKIVNNEVTVKALKVAKPRSLKVKCMLIPYKIKSVIIVMIMGKFLSLFKRFFPGIFNKLKNER